MKKKCLQSAVCFVLLVLASGCGLFKKPPEYEGVLVTPDNTKAVYLYSIFYYTSYSNNGGIINETGYKKSFFDIYEVATGKKLNNTALEVQSSAHLEDITNSSIMISYYNIDKSTSELMVYDIATGKLKLDNAAIESKNAGLKFNSSYSYRAVNTSSGFTLDGDDARVYLLDENTGKAEPLNHDKYHDKPSRDENFSDLNYFDKDSIRLSVSGLGRQKIVATTTHYLDTVYTYQSVFYDLPGGIYVDDGSLHLENYKKKKTISRHQSISHKEKHLSHADYIDPRIMGIRTSSWLHGDAIVWKNNTIIYSKTKSFNKHEWLFTAVTINTANELWSVALPNPLAEKKPEEIKNVYRVGNNLLIATDQSLNSLNLDNGKWNYNIRLVTELDD